MEIPFLAHLVWYYEALGFFLQVFSLTIMEKELAFVADYVKFPAMVHSNLGRNPIC
jgi:hypothetical protein